eukprot:1141245-Pelagomonas_calceolata.AAC.2
MAGRWPVRAAWRAVARCEGWQSLRVHAWVGGCKRARILSSRPQGSVEGSLQQSPLGPGSQLGHRDEPPLPQGHNVSTSPWTLSAAASLPQHPVRASSIPAGRQGQPFALTLKGTPAFSSTTSKQSSLNYHGIPQWHHMQEGLHFDVDGRVGVVFNISERYMLGTLSMLTVGMAPHEMYATMLRVLSFISNKEREMEQSSTMVQRRAALGLESLTSFRDLQVLVKYMAEKSAAVVRNHQSVRVPSIASSSTLL